MKDKLIFIFAIVIICLAFLLGKSCSKDKLILQPKEIITNYRDTIFPKDTIYKDSLVPQWYTRVDTILKPVYIDSTQCNRIYVYNDTISKKEYDAYLQSHVQGLLRSSVLEVKLKVPLTIKDCTVVKRDTFIYIPSKYQFNVGLQASPQSLVPMIELGINRSSYGLGYDPFNKFPIVTYKYRIFQSKK
jgi:hypothetical protein